MHFNPLIAPALLLAYALAMAAYAIMRDAKTASLRTTCTVIAALATLPAVSMPLYYLHLYDHWAAYYSFRAFRFSELTASGAGLAAGVLAFWSRHFRVGGRLLDLLIIILLTLGIAAPYAKPVLAPVRPGVFVDRWSNGVCLQSTASCGAACAATFLKRSGFEVIRAPNRQGMLHLRVRN